LSDLAVADLRALSGNNGKALPVFVTQKYLTVKTVTDDDLRTFSWAYVFSDPSGVLTIKIVQKPHILPLGHGFKKSFGSENAVLACSL
jgi:hypothetical protein